MKVKFLDLNKQHKFINARIKKAFNGVFAKSDFILGQEERLFEEEFARYCQAKYAVGVNSGADALFLSLLSLGIGPGDEVIVPDFTFIATAFAVNQTGASPVFVDIDEKTYNIDVEKAREAITDKTKAVIPVHLFGQLSDMGSLKPIADRRGIKVIEDACQAHGAKLINNSQLMAGNIGDLGCFSFYPTKNLGGFGDGGMITTNDKSIHYRICMMRDCGRKSKYEHAVMGFNSRLDTIQAAVLRVKLPYLDNWNAKRHDNAQYYNKILKDIPGLILPFEAAYSTHIYHIYAVRVKNRDKVVEFLKNNGIGVMVNYPIPLHLQEVYKSLGHKPGDFPVSERVSKDIISLPMHPQLTKKEMDYVGEKLKQALC